MVYIFVVFICLCRALIETYFVPFIPTSLEWTTHYFLFFLSGFFLFFLGLFFVLKDKKKSLEILSESFPVLIFAPVIDYLLMPYKAMRYPSFFSLENLIPFNVPATYGQLISFSLFLFLIFLQIKDFRKRIFAVILLYYLFFFLSYSCLLFNDFFLHSFFLGIIPVFCLFVLFKTGKKGKRFF